MSSRVIFRYVSRGLSLSGRAGNVSYFDADCYRAIILSTAGPTGRQIEGAPPAGTRCYGCGKELTSEPKCPSASGGDGLPTQMTGKAT